MKVNLRIVQYIFFNISLKIVIFFPGEKFSVPIIVYLLLLHIYDFLCFRMWEVSVIACLPFYLAWACSKTIDSFSVYLSSVG